MCIDYGGKVDLSSIDLRLQDWCDPGTGALALVESFGDQFILFGVSWVNDDGIFRAVIGNKIGVVIAGPRPWSTI